MIAAEARAVAIGASAGAIQALLQILPVLPADYPLPVLVVVHLPPGRRSELVTLFAAKCKLRVAEGEDKDPIAPGTVTFAPPDYHMLVEAGGTVSLSRDEAVFFSRPSIDVLFESAADAYGPGLVGVVLTGANEDGARGLVAVAEAGGVTIVQDPATAYARAMPEAALAKCRQAQVLSIKDIAAALLEVGQP
ncbi:chemotaxis protein CheB [Novosphingobium sp. FGD1]|uniref:protein-glutamate methylesterase n=1 Tax=Novosphingobium silvae TaxID=2692619 RepID=A0A7X4GH88_9SPHN|nr:chemotaxis protein CheB [Novosphingobium silvae]MYL98523.1 chemotaxis protein CheB [Novosphingobium silvae]